MSNTIRYMVDEVQDKVDAHRKKMSTERFCELYHKSLDCKRRNTVRPIGVPHLEYVIYLDMKEREQNDG